MRTLAGRGGQAEKVEAAIFGNYEILREEVMEDKYYKLTFFASDKLGEYPQEELQDFVCPQNYDTIDDARLIAEYWMRLDAFACVRCDEYCEDAYGMGRYALSKSGVFIGQRVGDRVHWKNWGESNNEMALH